MTKEGSSTDPLAIATRGLLKLLVRFRRGGKRLIEDVPTRRRKRALLVRINDTLRRCHGVRQHEVADARFLIGRRPLKLALALRIDAQVHAVSFDVGSLTHQSALMFFAATSV